MISRQKLLLSLAFLLLPISGFPQTSSPPATPASVNQETIQVTRGQAISQSGLAAIADIASARDEKGNPVVLNEDSNYVIGSYTRTTIRVIVRSGV